MNETLEQIVARVERELAEWPPHTVSNLEFARRLVAALGAQEPVAWMDETRSALTNEIECVKEYPSANWQPLYAAPVVPADWQMVPKEPTPEMWDAAWSGFCDTKFEDLHPKLSIHAIRRLYALFHESMLSAAPEYK